MSSKNLQYAIFVVARGLCQQRQEQARLTSISRLFAGKRISVKDSIDGLMEA